MSASMEKEEKGAMLREIAGGGWDLQLRSLLSHSPMQSTSTREYGGMHLGAR